MFAWSGLINAILAPRLRAASYLGISGEELQSLAAVTALEAELSWEPDGGRSITSWVWLHVEFVVRRRLARAAREFARESADEEIGEWATADGEDPETAVLVSEALTYLQAELSQADWWLLWMFHGQGYSAKELAAKLSVSYGRLRNKLSAARQRAVTILELAER